MANKIYSGRLADYSPSVIYCDAMSDVVNIVKLDFFVTADTGSVAGKTYYLISSFSGAATATTWATGVYEKNSTNRFEAGSKIIVGGGAIQYTYAASGFWNSNATPLYDVAIIGTNCTVAITRDGVAVTEGAGMVAYNDRIIITATPTSGSMTVLTVNNVTITNGASYVVTGNVVIAATAA